MLDCLVRLVGFFNSMCDFIVSDSENLGKPKFNPSYLFFRDKLSEGRYKKEKEKSRIASAQPRDLPATYSATESKETVLFITDGIGGEIDQHVQYMTDRLEDEGVKALISYYDPSKKSFIISRYEIDDDEKLEFRFPKKYAELFVTLRELKIKKVNICHTQFLPFYFLKDITSFTKALGADLTYSIYDYLPICPRLYLVDNSGTYCGEPPTKTCNTCVKKAGRLAVSPKDVGEWKKAHTKIFKAAENIFVPSDGVAKKFKAHFPKTNIIIRPLPEAPPQITPQTIKRREGENLRLAIIGDINEFKGSNIVLECIKDASERNLPIEFRIIGRTDYDEQIEQYSNVTVITGKYDYKELPRHFREQLCHAALFPSVFPEVLQFTLSHAIMGCLFPIVFDMGIMAETIRKIGWGTIIPIDIMENAEAINNAILEINLIAKPKINAEDITPHYESLKNDYYG